MISAPLRSAVLSHAPGLAHLCRLLRDKVAAVAPPVKTVYGFKLIGDRSVSDPCYEKEEIDFFVQNLRHAAICVDIGANIGLYTCLAASLGKPVVAIEPLPRNLACLHKNLAANGFDTVEVLPVGLSSEIGTKRLFGTGGCASFSPGWAGSSEKRFRSVPVSTLDSIVTGLPKLRPMLIKMDVEGLELEVLRGADMTLSMVPKPTWLVEIRLDSGLVVGGRNTKFAETFEVFWKHGYQGRTPVSQDRIVKPEDVIRWSTQGHVDFGNSNYIFSDPLT
jgi:FkbM family methyltransferase